VINFSARTNGEQIIAKIAMTKKTMIYAPIINAAMKNGIKNIKAASSTIRIL
jgi:hypothetical protein